MSDIVALIGYSLNNNETNKILSRINKEIYSDLILHDPNADAVKCYMTEADDMSTSGYAFSRSGFASAIEQMNPCAMLLQYCNTKYSDLSMHFNNDKKMCYSFVKTGFVDPSIEAKTILDDIFLNSDNNDHHEHRLEDIKKLYIKYYKEQKDSYSSFLYEIFKNGTVSIFLMRDCGKYNTPSIYMMDFREKLGQILISTNEKIMVNLANELSTSISVMVIPLSHAWNLRVNVGLDHTIYYDKYEIKYT